MPGGSVVGELALSKISWKLVERIFANWEDEIQPTTRSRYASTLSKVFEHAKRSGWLRSNPVAEARRPKVPTHRPNVPEPGEVRDALSRAKSADFGLYAYVMGVATTGCRRSELLATTVEDLDLGGGVVTIRASIADGGPGRGTYRKATNRDDWRDVPLTAQMVDVFNELLDRRRAGLAEFDTTQLDERSYVFSDDPEGARRVRERS
jgi:integrase